MPPGSLTPEIGVTSAVGHIRKALEALTSSDEGSASTGAGLMDGRYRGGNGEYLIELRVDRAVSGMISADVSKADAVTGTWLASVRSLPGAAFSIEDGIWGVVAEDQGHASATGSLALTVQLTDPLTVGVTLHLDKPLAGIPGQTDVLIAATWDSAQLRSLGIELEQEEGVPDLPEYDHRGRTVTFESALEAAGFEVRRTGRRTEIPKPPTPWGTAQVDALAQRLHELMVRHGQADLGRPAWLMRLLLLSESAREGLLGVMFDSTDPLPRQGTAVFAKEIEDWAADFERKYIQTTLHETAHGLNLAHRFEREVGRADSTSIMNYDWRYRGGDLEHEFWAKFDFTFDHDELSFLRHGPRSAVIPGGKAFHSVSYWAEGNGGYTPYFPEVQVAEFDLKLSGPIGGLVFDFLQPVFLEVELTNNSGQSFDVPKWWLDPKAGALDIVVRRVASGGGGDSQHWVPVMQRCMDITPGTMDSIPNGGSMKNNLNLTFGSAGFSFAEPGEYEVQAVVSLPNRALQREFIIPSNKLRLRVGYPKSREEESDALVLLRGDVGMYLALGGSPVLERAHDDLQVILERRLGKAKKATDPIAANILRCAGIDAGRAYLLPTERKFETIAGDRGEAAQLLEQLDDTALRAFDAHTAASTKSLAAKHRRAVSNGR